MRRIVLHIGPEKCGSTSIQRAITDPGAPWAGALHGIVLNPYLVVALEDPASAANARAQIGALISQAQAAHPGKTLVLSHEMIFKSLPILTAMAEIARDHSESVTAIAYLRRVGDLILSGFRQWHFRAPERLQAARDLLIQNGLEPDLFSAHERHLIAALLRDDADIARQPSGHSYVNWAHSVPERALALREAGAHLSLGVVPRRAGDPPLVADFLRRAEIQADTPPTKGTTPNIPAEPIANPGFAAPLVEAVAQAVLAGHPMPGQHEANNFMVDSADLTVLRTLPAEGDSALGWLCAALDGARAEANRAMASDYALPHDYFAPDQPIDAHHARARLTDLAASRQPELSLRQTRAREAAALAALSWHWFRHASKLAQKNREGQAI